MIAYLLFSITGAILWSMIQNQFSPQNLAVGFLWGVGIALLWRSIFVGEPWTGATRRRFWLAALYVLILAKEILLANIVVFRLVARVLRGGSLVMRPGIVAVPTDLKSDVGVVTLANSITLTPGTFTVFITPDKGVLYVHALDMGDGGPQGVRDAIKKSLEAPILRVER